MIAIGLINYNCELDILRCVESIETTIDCEYKVYIVDNKSGQDSIDFLLNNYKLNNRVEIILLDQNYGYSRANNEAIKSAKTDGFKQIIISNSDIIFLRHAIKVMYQRLLENDDIVIVGPKIYYRNLSTVQHSTRLKEQTLLEVMGLSKSMKSLDEDNLIESKIVYSVSGCCFAVNINKFESIDYFDEEVFLYNEENIISFKSAKSGLITLFEPKACVVHNHGSTTGINNMFVNKEYIKSSIYYWYYYKNKRKISLYIFKWFLVSKWLIKSLYTKSMRKKWLTFFRETRISAITKKRNKFGIKYK